MISKIIVNFIYLSMGISLQFICLTVLTHRLYYCRAEHVLRMRVVTANGTIADLSPGRVTLHPKYDHEPVTHLNDNDLFFAMRGAGMSYAIATEFLYQIYPTPETQPAIFLGNN